MFDLPQLRRLALVQVMHRLGINLSAAAAIFELPGDERRSHLKEQIAALQDLITRAEAARDFLGHAVECTAEHPVEQCPHMLEVLDRRLAGETFEELVHSYGRTVPEVRSPLRPFSA
jgi:hypothetical protein